MPIVATYPKLRHDWLKHELDPQLYRKAVTILAGAGDLITGTVMGKVTASGKWKKHVNGASDGTEVAAGILLDARDASGGSDVAGVILTGKAEIASLDLTWDASVDNSTKKNAALAQLATLDIFDRKLA